MNTSLEGHIRIDLDCVGQPRVAVCRPLDMQQLLWHKTRDEVRARMGALYGICRHSHNLASELAYARLDEDQPPHHLPLLRLRALLENIQEGLWHLCMVLPQALGRTPPVGHMAKIRRVIATIVECPELDLARMSIQDHMETLLSAETLLTHSRMLEDDMLLAESRIAGLPLPALPSLDETLILQHLEWLDGQINEHPDFVSLPALPAGCAENTPDRTDNRAPLTSRVRQLTERIRASLEALKTDTPESALPCGARRIGDRALSWTETSRGWLIHSLALKDGRTRRYRIVAPTEWNFHPQGPVAHHLKAAAQSSGMPDEHSARLIALAWNPCVPLQVSTSEPGVRSHA
ncbi:MAG: hypothetical protein D6758_05680 [Gammaproteobacteria bacterium]|nr:MAG: hypothetical protein D6758_05680 [Gammaproteobacteria bacterium]